MRDLAIRRVVIVGGGTAGWMAAAVLSNALQHRFCEVALIDSADPLAAGAGEAAAPPFLRLLDALGVEEDMFVRRTGATYKLGVKFVNWKQSGQSYFHPFGRHGLEIGPIEFPHYWRRLRHELGDTADALEAYSLPSVLALARKFSRPVPDPDDLLSTIAYAFHFDAEHCAAFLREYAEARGVRRHKGEPRAGELDERGFVSAVRLKDGRRIAGDLFIDCTGPRGLLINQLLRTSFEDWSRWLPCDRALVAPCARIEDPTPYTRATAQRAGWQWRIPLQHRTGNGHVYCSAFVDEDEAIQTLLANLDGEPLADPVGMSFTPGRRSKAWNRNVVALGAAGGVLEPLESTGIHLIQAGLSRLITLFPDRAFRQADIDRYNQATAAEYDQIRDFLILHYHANRRSDPFWMQCAVNPIPDTLAETIALFRSRGRVFRDPQELFGGSSWTAVFEGQGVHPECYDPLADAMPADRLRSTLARIRDAMKDGAEGLPSHGDFIRAHGAFEPAGPAAVRPRRMASSLRS